jgi:bifunctional DNase/RNase
MIEVRVAHLGLDRATNTPVVILQEKEGERVLPIWIGPAEASAIAMELAGVKFSRPLTHDLVKQVVVGLGADLERVLIVQIDARPSDSIAVALRLKAPIFTDEGLLELTSIDTVEPMSADAEDMDPDSLKTYLENLDPEDFGKFTP